MPAKSSTSDMPVPEKQRTLSEAASKIVKDTTEELLPNLLRDELPAVEERIYGELLKRISTEELLDALRHSYGPRANYFGGLSRQGRVNADTVDFLQSDSGAVTDDVQTELRRTVWLDQFGTAADGATDDASKINACLLAHRGKIVRGNPGKTYAIGSPLVVYSGTTLDMTGCTVTLKASSNCNMLRNAGLTAARTVFDAVMSASSTTLTSATAAFVSGDTGAQIVVWGAGPNGAPFFTTVSSVTNGTTVTLAASASTAVSGQTLSIGTRDTGIQVLGGTWAMGVNGGAALDNYAFRLRRLDSLTIRDVSITSSSGKYAISLGDITGYKVQNISLTVFSDGVHVEGPADSGLIENIGGTSGDDSVALTPYNYVANADVRGDITDCLIRNVYTRTALTQIKLLGGNGYNLKRITAANLNGEGTGASSGAIWIGDDTASANCIGGLCDLITVDDIKPITSDGVPLVFINGTNVKRVRLSRLEQDKATATVAMVSVAPATATTIEEIAIDRVRVANQNQKPVIETNANATVTKLLIDRVSVSAIATGAGSIVASIGAPITSMELSGFAAPNLTLGAAVVNVASTITSLIIRGAHLVSSSGNTQLVQLSTGATITDLSIEGYTGSTAGSHVVSVSGSAAVLTRCRISNSQQNGGSSWVGAPTNTQTVGTVEIANCTGSGMSWALVDMNTTTELHAINLHSFTLSSGLINVRASGAITVYGHNVSVGGAVNATIAAGGALRSKSVGLAFDVGLTGVSKTNGDMAFNTNASTVPGAAPVICDGASWRRIGKATQSPAFAASYTPDLNLGNNVVVGTLTGNITVNNWSNTPGSGEPVTFTFTQDGTGGWTVTWGANYIFPTAWTNTGNTAAKKSQLTFISDGSKLIAQGANIWY